MEFRANPGRSPSTSSVARAPSVAAPARNAEPATDGADAEREVPTTRDRLELQFLGAAAGSLAGAPPPESPSAWTTRDRLIQRFSRPAAAMQLKADGARTGDGPAPAPASAGGSSGSHIPDAVRTRMEHSFRADFSDVRVHRGRHAPSVGAIAYTQGSDIHFAPGKYDPSSQSGQELLGHELTHVVQQRAGRVSAPGQGKGAPINADAGLEAEADRAGARAALGEPVHVTGAGGGAQAKAQGGGSLSGSVPTGDVIQRKVGFEFETAVPVRADTSGGMEDIGYKTMIYAGKNSQWHVEADSSSMEFVTEPFETNTAGKAALEETMAEITNAIDQMRSVDATKLSQKKPFFLKQATTHGTAYKVGGSSVLVGDGGSQRISKMKVIAAPQASGGVTLDKIPLLMAAHAVEGALPHLTGTGAQQSLSGMVPEQGIQLDKSADWGKAYIDNLKSELSEAKKPIPSHGFLKLQGLVSLVLSYLRSGRDQMAVWSYSKLIAPLMARTDFHQLFLLLEKDEKPYFTVDRICHVIGVEPGGKVFKKGFRYKGATDPIQYGPTREDWIESIVNGPIDLMSFGGGTTVAGGEEEDAPTTSGTSSGMGAFHKPDKRDAPDSGGGADRPVDLAVLELRRLPKTHPYGSSWLETARVIFDMFKQLTELKLGDQSDEMPPPAPRGSGGGQLDTGPDPSSSQPQSAPQSQPQPQAPSDAPSHSSPSSGPPSSNPNKPTE